MSNTNATHKCYSRDDETYRFRTLGELLDDMACNDELEVGATYYEADCEPVKPALFDYRIESLLEELDDDLFEEVGEVADCDFSSVSDEAKEELCALMRAWIEKHVNVANYWRITGKPRECVVTAEDVAGYAP